MFNMEAAKEEFLNYTNKYDKNNENIERKIFHSLRVMDISNKIAKTLNLTNEQIELATLIGLLHDIGRFEQMKQYNTFSDYNSIDHADLSVKILKENNYLHGYIETDKYDKIILIAIKNHNKYEIDKSVSGDELIFSKIIRDADKIDILYEGTEMFWKNKENEVEESILSQNIKTHFEEKHLIQRNKQIDRSNIDRVCSQIAFIFDINYLESFKILKEEDYINKIINRYEFKDTQTKNAMEEIRKISNDYINEKIN